MSYDSRSLMCVGGETSRTKYQIQSQTVGGQQMVLGSCIHTATESLDCTAIEGILSDLLTECRANLSDNFTTLRLFYLETIPRDLIERGRRLCYMKWLPTYLHICNSSL